MYWGYEKLYSEDADANMWGTVAMDRINGRLIIAE